MNVHYIYECERHYHAYQTARGDVRWRQLLTLKAVRKVAGLIGTRRYECHIGELDIVFWDTHQVGQAQLMEAFSQKLFDELPRVKS